MLSLYLQNRDTAWIDIYELGSYELCPAGNGYTTPPASIAAEESQRAGEGKVARIGHTTESTRHHILWSLMQVGFYSFFASII